jgi:hypothetical protein
MLCLIRYGRHDEIELHDNSVSHDCMNNIDVIISRTNTSEFMKNLSKLDVGILKECCQNTTHRLRGDYRQICIDSVRLFATWKEERKFRITSFRCYELYTYANNKKPNWERKSLNYFYPKEHSNKYVQHEIQNEPIAREVYENNYQLKVHQCGLVVSNNNPWLACSPDGVILDENGNVLKLIEIKCPFHEKDHNIDDVVPKLKYLDEHCTLKKRHMYYTQVQLCMAIMNVQVTDLMIFASFDNTSLVIPVPIDEEYVTDLVDTLKRVYFQQMLHFVCTYEKNNK